MNNTEYQAYPAVSSHWLIDFIWSPVDCWRRHLDPERVPDAPSDACRFGALVHGLALTPGQFDRDFVVMAQNRRTGAGREAWATALATGRVPVSPSEFEKARALVAALKAHKAANRLLIKGKKERTIIQPRARGLLPLKARLDVHIAENRHVVELKTIRDISLIGPQMARFRYALSAAFYRDITHSQKTTFVFVEKREPYPVELVEMSRAQLEEGRIEYRTALRAFDECWQSGVWPEAEASADDDLTMNLLPGPAANRPRFDLPVGEVAL